MILRHLCALHSMSQDEAEAHYHGLSGRQKDAIQARAERVLVERRREAAGRPVFQPRADFVRGV